MRAPGPSPDGAPTQVVSREDAVRAIDGVCAWFERHKPSSPVPVLLRRAMRLDGADFLDILRELDPGRDRGPPTRTVQHRRRKGSLSAFHEKLSRIRKPRVRIAYEVETGGAQVLRGLPFVTGRPGGPLRQRGARRSHRCETAASSRSTATTSKR